MQNGFSRLPPKSVARQEALWQDTVREGSVRTLCQGREYNSRGAYLPLKRSSPRPQFYRLARRNQGALSSLQNLLILKSLIILAKHSFPSPALTCMAELDRRIRLAHRGL